MYPVQFIAHVVTIIANRNLESVLVTEFSARRTEYEMMLRFCLSAAEYTDVIVFGYYTSVSYTHLANALPPYLHTGKPLVHRDTGQVLSSAL